MFNTTCKISKRMALWRSQLQTRAFSAAAKKHAIVDQYNQVGRNGKSWTLPGETDYWTTTPYHQTTLPIENAWTLTPKAYYDQQFAQVEAEKIFSRDWVCVAHTSQLSNPGDMMSADFAGKSILLTRSKSGKLNAFYNSCRHRGTKLVNCQQNRPNVSCPYHHWCYSLDGELLAAPQFLSGDKRKRGKRSKLDMDTEKFHLIPVQTDSWGPLVFVNLDPNCDPLSKQLGDLPQICQNYPLDNLEPVRTKQYNPHCNWKLLCENFMEWYHLEAVHPALCGFSVPDNHENMPPGDHHIKFRTYPIADCGSAADTTNFPTFPNLSEEEKQQALFYHIYPNVSVSLYPHSAYTLIMLPDGKDPGKTNEQLNLLMSPETRFESDSDEGHAKKVDDLMAFVCNVNDEDVDICESVQEGVVNPTYPGGRFSVELENHIYNYQHMIINAMTRDDDTVGTDTIGEESARREMNA